MNSKVHLMQFSDPSPRAAAHEFLKIPWPTYQLQDEVRILEGSE